jgi:Fatty acid desaturase
MLADPRDEIFVRLSLRVLATQSAAMGLLYAGLQSTHVPALVLGLIYLAFWGWSVPPVILMLHCTMHRKFIVNPKLLDWAHPFVMSFFFGMPMGYREHHIGMHHVEDNLGRDLSSTLSYRRDSFLHFLAYFGRFFVFIPFELPLYLARNKRSRMARRAVLGELMQWTVIASAISLDWRFGVIAFLMPCVLCRFMMMAGNWGQHAFINTAHPNNGLSNSISCINSSYNKRCFNDGYHIGHHVRAKRHWSELPGDFLANRETYARHGAIVFEKLDFFMVSLCLWLGLWNVLAKHFVRLDGPKSDAEVVAMLKSRVHPVREWPGAEAPRRRGGEARAATA